MGDLRLEARAGAVNVATLVEQDWPAYAAGLEQDDQLRVIDGRKIGSAADVEAALARLKPGEVIDIAFTDRGGKEKTARLTLGEDQAVEAVGVEQSGGTLTPLQRTFRDRWLGPK
jgi:S1-C subfamily serine protease